MDELQNILGEANEANSETLSLCVTPTIRSKFEKLTEILDQRRLKRSGLARLKDALNREIDVLLKMAENNESEAS